MNTDPLIEALLTSGESEVLEFKAVLPPSKSIARILCAFANSKGGTLLLGVDESSGMPTPVGLSRDFHASEVTKKAVSLVAPEVQVTHGYVDFRGHALYLIEVKKAERLVSVEGKSYLRSANRVILSEPVIALVPSCAKVKNFMSKLEKFGVTTTEAKNSLLEHYRSVLKIVDDLGSILYPNSSNQPTESQEGRILTRILFSTCADNFELYLSDLLYEIYLANPDTLKSNEQVTVEDVLKCADLREFIDMWTRRKLSKLERGSVKAFVKENKQINQLNVLDSDQQYELEKILQVRHLYTHRNGIVDEKFLNYFPGQFAMNQEHCLSVDSMIDNLEYLASTVDRIDSAAIAKYRLATIS